MDSIPISKFKATCTAVIEQVEATRTSVIITRRGKPVAEVVPHTPMARNKKRLGYMAGSAQILDDLVSLFDEALAGIGDNVDTSDRRALKDRDHN